MSEETHAVTAQFLTWNTKSGRHFDAQLQLVREQRPDIVALQEIASGSIARYREGLAQVGLRHAADSYEQLTDGDRVDDPLRGRCVLLASRWPLHPLAPLVAAPWPERYVAAVVESSFGEVEVHVVHMPIGMRKGNAPDWRKVATFEALYERLSVRCARHRILCGDFNTPKSEKPGRPPETWAFERYRPRLTPVEQQRWRDAELNILVGLAAFDLADAFRACCGPEATAFSWYARSAAFAATHAREHAFYGRRFDHIFCSESLGVTKVNYGQNHLEHGWSDHAPVVAHFVPRDP